MSDSQPRGLSIDHAVGTADRASAVVVDLEIYGTRTFEVFAENGQLIGSGKLEANETEIAWSEI